LTVEELSLSSYCADFTDCILEADDVQSGDHSCRFTFSDTPTKEEINLIQERKEHYLIKRLELV